MPKEGAPFFLEKDWNGTVTLKSEKCRGRWCVVM